MIGSEGEGGPDLKRKTVHASAATPHAPGDIERARRIVLLGLALGACCLMGLMLWPFLPAVVTSGVLAVLVAPGFERLSRRSARKSLNALVATIVVFFLGLIPAIVLSFLLVDEVGTGIGWIGSDASGLLAPAGPVARWIDEAARLLGLERTDLAAMISSQAQGLFTTLAGRTINLFTGLGGWLLQAGIALFTLYYLMRDGDEVVAYLKWLVPLDEESSNRLFRRAGEIIHATVFGSIAVAFVQGALGGLTFWALGLRGPIVWGAVMAVLALLPAIGAWFVWAPAAAMLFFGGSPVRGLILLAIGTLIISTVDNVLRAVLVSERAQLHPLVVFFSVLGGLLLFGVAGIFIGPVLFVTALTIVEIARLSIEPAGAAPFGTAMTAGQADAASRPVEPGTPA